jgi:hypothetical protein
VGEWERTRALELVPDRAERYKNMILVDKFRREEPRSSYLVGDRVIKYRVKPKRTEILFQQITFDRQLVRGSYLFNL